MKFPQNSSLLIRKRKRSKKQIRKAAGFFTNLFSSIKRLPGIKQSLNYLEQKKKNDTFKTFYENEKNKTMDTIKQRQMLNEIKPQNINLATNVNEPVDSRFNIDLNWAKDRGYKPPMLSNANWKFQLNKAQKFARQQLGSGFAGKGIRKFKYPY